MIPTAILLLSFLSPLLALALLVVLFVTLRLKRRVDSLTIAAHNDPLTGLPNRRGLARAWESTRGDKALLLIDLVGFKAMNDTHGHMFGDALLQQVARRLQAAVSPYGVLSRWGGDEFAAILPADRLDRQQAILASAQIMPYVVPGSDGQAVEVRIGARFGVAQGVATLETAIAIADARLMEARSS